MPSRTCIVLFTIAGCPACAEHAPIFRRVAAAYASRIPVHVLDANDPRHTALADRVGVRAVPATALLRRPTGVVRLDGVADEDDLRRLFELAIAYA